MSTEDLKTSHEAAIAIVGMSGRFPGADTPDALWKNVKDGVESSTAFSDAELLRKGVSESRLKRREYVRSGFVIDGIDQFDAGFFHLTPRDAEILDPQQRIFLESSWHALENAGYVPEKFQGRIGVYAGTFTSKYLFNILSHPSIVDTVGEMAVRHGNDKDYLATRVSYKLNLRGPSISVQTSCSTSLVAVHMATQALLSGECDMALVGGVSIDSAHGRGYMHQPGGLMSPDGKCRPFDAEAQGTAFGDGIGIVVLRRYADAVADGATIYAVIRGTAINNDGSDKIGFIAPSVSGQAGVIEEALAVAGIPARTVGLIEAHGTGTPLGDPIEIEALRQVYQAEEFVAQSCAIGSIKANVGHLGVASGVTGLIKASLALHHKQLPPTINHTRPNPHIDFANSPFFVNTRLREWPAPVAHPRRAAISNFGMGGTNAHLVLEEAQEVAERAAEPASVSLRVSAKSPRALKASLQRLATFLRENPSAALRDVETTLALGRRDWECRYVCQAEDRQSAIRQLEAVASSDGTSTSHVDAIKTPELVFVFPGQGSQYLGACRDLYRNNNAFRTAIDQCRQALANHSSFDIVSAIEASSDDSAVGAALQRTENTQPFLFSVEFALAKMLEEAGLVPTAMIGHSVGEIVAATLAGVFDLPGALRLIAIRGRTMQSAKPGKMLAVMLAEGALRDLLVEYPGIEIAAVNGPNACVVAGEATAVENLRAGLADVGVQVRPLMVEHAFHSSLLDPVLDRFEQEISDIPRNAPRLPFISNISGTWADPELVVQPRYWVEQMRRPVRFADGVQTLVANANSLFVEVGPGAALSGLIKAQLDMKRHARVVSLVRPASQSVPDDKVLGTALENLWANGADVRAREHKGRRIPLPVYEFERNSFWLPLISTIEEPVTGQAPESNHPAGPQATLAPAEQAVVAEVASGAGVGAVITSSPKEILAGIWKGLFNVAVIDVDEDFFSLGGTSLAAMQLVARIKDLAGVELSMEELLDEPTFNGIAARLSERLAS